MNKLPVFIGACSLVVGEGQGEGKTKTRAHSKHNHLKIFKRLRPSDLLAGNVGNQEPN
jgi:hypothetical protein